MKTRSEIEARRYAENYGFSLRKVRDGVRVTAPDGNQWIEPTFAHSYNAMIINRAKSGSKKK